MQEPPNYDIMNPTSIDNRLYDLEEGLREFSGMYADQNNPQSPGAYQGIDLMGPPMMPSESMGYAPPSPIQPFEPMGGGMPDMGSMAYYGGDMGGDMMSPYAGAADYGMSSYGSGGIGGLPINDGIMSMMGGY
tara:strand:+ start:1173 stop:1571 length:399 start_codon:yes stop_codon:yes gene_type:complete